MFLTQKPGLMTFYNCSDEFYLQPDISEHTLHYPQPATSKTGTQFTYPGGMEGWVDLDALITPRPGIEPTITLTDSPMT